MEDGPLVSLKLNQTLDIPFPNEILDEIITFAILENLHSICMPDAPSTSQWNALLILPSVCTLFRTMSMRTYAEVFCLKAEERGSNFPFERILRSIANLRHASRFFFKDLASEEESGEFFLREVDQADGILGIYWGVARCRIYMSRGISTSDDVEVMREWPRMAGATNISLALCRYVPTKLTCYAWNAVIDYNLPAYLALEFALTRMEIMKAIGHGIPLSDPNISSWFKLTFDALNKAVTFFMESVPPDISPSDYTKHKSRMPSILQDSGLSSVLERVLALDGDDPHGVKEKVSDFMGFTK